MKSKPYIDRFVPHTWYSDILIIAVGLGFVELASLFKFYLQGNPVPVSALTFAVGLTALCIGGVRAAIVMAILVALRFVSDALDTGSFHILPSSGYTIAMILTAFAIGTLAQYGYAKGFFRTFIILTAGGLSVLAIGSTWLAVDTGKSVADVVSTGVVPFLIGNFIKDCSGALIYSKVLPRFKGSQSVQTSDPAVAG